MRLRLLAPAIGILSVLAVYCLDHPVVTAAGATAAMRQTARAGASTPSRTAHPRLLLSRDDPFTGLQRLRERYARGERPSDDVCGNALSWLVTGDESFAQKAVARLRNERPPERVGSRTYPAYVCLSLAFDWLYDYAGFDDALKSRVAGDLAAAAERMLQDPSLRQPDAVSYQNYSARFLALAAFAATAAAEYPPLAERTRPLLEKTRRSFDNILRTTDLVTPDGGYHESMDYMRITMAALTMLSELRRTADGDDPAWRFGVFRNISRTYLYKLLPDGTSSREGDDEYPFPKRDDAVVLAYATSRFKDPYAAWLLRESGWVPDEWLVPVLKFLWADPIVAPRDPRAASSEELPRHQWFRGIDHVVLRDGWTPQSTWIQFLSGPFFAKHQHLDAGAFTIHHGGWLAIDSGADYTDTESPHYLNYYRRTVAHNSMLVYDPGEIFFWGEDLWRAANDGGQRMDSSRYWNTIRSIDDWERTRDLWDVAHVNAASFHDGSYQYVKGDISRAYSARKVSSFTRELLYLPGSGWLAVYDRLRTTRPDLRKTWLLHGVSQPAVDSPAASRAEGHGGTSFGAATRVTWHEGTGALRVYPLLPERRDVVVRGGDGWEFWTPGDDRGGDWGTGRNWPLEPWAGGPLPDDPYLRRMWQTFWGADFTQLSPSNQRSVVPGSWRMEVSPSEPGDDVRFLTMLKIGDRDDPDPPSPSAIDGYTMSAAVAGDIVVAFARGESPLRDGELTLPDSAVRQLYIAGLAPNASYDVQWTDLGIPKGAVVVRADAGGVGILRHEFAASSRVRLHALSRQ